MLKIGEKAPADVEVLNSEGKAVSLKDFAEKNLILYFYPKDDTPRCTKEVCSARDWKAELKKLGTELQMVPIRNAAHIPAYWTLLDDKGNFKTDSLKENAERFLTQLVWWGKVLKDARKQG